MAVKVRPVKLERHPKADPDEDYLSKSKPFVSNPRGMLCHRPRFVHLHHEPWRRRTHTAFLWCNSMQHVPEGAFVDSPGERLLCAVCERNAVEAGELPAAAIIGRHVHVGRLRPVRTCCSDENN